MRVRDYMTVSFHSFYSPFPDYLLLVSQARLNSAKLGEQLIQAGPTVTWRDQFTAHVQTIIAHSISFTFLVIWMICQSSFTHAPNTQNFKTPLNKIHRTQKLISISDRLWSNRRKGTLHCQHASSDILTNLLASFSSLTSYFNHLWSQLLNVWCYLHEAS